MPLAVAALIRVLIQAAVQTGIFVLISKLIAPLTDAAKSAVAFAFNMTPEEAQDTIANEVIDAFAMIGIIGVSIKTKLPTIAAEKLGFTSKGYAKRPISGKLPPKVAGSVGSATTATVAKAVVTEAEATARVATMKAQNLGFAKYYALAIGTLGVVQLTMMNIGNWIDFGNWNSGAYQKTMQKFIAWITFGKLVPDEDYRKSKVASDDVFTKVFNTYKLGGAVGINDPYKLQSVPFTRNNLLDIIDQAGATLLLASGSAPTKAVLVATLPMIIFDTSVNVDELLSIKETTVTTASGVATTTPTTKVYTGIVSQGVVGAGLVFTSRPDDMIESLEELKTAAANNLAPFLAALPGKIVYEVKIVAQVITKEGFTQRGTTQKIQTGTYANGSPKYKTVTNKFATLVVYALTDKGSRAKLTTIVLGPTDSAKLTVSQNNVSELEKALPGIVTTTNIADIAGIAQTHAPVATTTGSPAPAPRVMLPIPAKGVFQSKNPPFFGTLYKIENGSRVAWSPYPSLYTQEEQNRLSQDPGKFAQNEQKLKDLGVITSDIAIVPFIADRQPGETGEYRGVATFAEFFGTTPSVSVLAPLGTTVNAKAKTLYELYTAQGKQLPSIEERSKIYEEKGLGVAAYYTGTAEQNTKLLNALQA